MFRLLGFGLLYLLTVAVGLAYVNARLGHAEFRSRLDGAVWLEQLNAEDPALRREAVQAVGNMGPEAAEAVPDLVRALKDPDAGVRRQAAKALGNIGPAAREASVPLAEAMMDTDK